MRSKKVKLKLFCLADELTSSTSISGDLLFTTVSELILIPDRNHQNQPITCFANNTAMEQPIEQQAFLDVQSKLYTTTRKCIKKLKLRGLNTFAWEFLCII